MTIKSDLVYSLLKQDLDANLGTGFCEEASQGLWVDATFLQAAGCSVLQSFLKKESKSSTAITDEKARQKFLSINEDCRNWQLPVLNSWTEELLGDLRQIIYNFWYRDTMGLGPNIHPYELFELGSVGPGVSIGARGNSFYAKLFSSPLTAGTSSIVQQYKHYISQFPKWQLAESIRASTYGEPIVVSSNRLSFVPKNDEISRCICIEPTLSTITQSGVGRIIERLLDERFGISLSKQPDRNRELARLGSRSDELVTIDLSSASDSMSLKMLHYVLPPQFFRLLCEHRSLSTLDGPRTVELHMVSTMGNGFTFPLQTMLFSAVVGACMKRRGIPFDSARYSKSWGVFGDDIICPEIVSRDVISLLTLLGFKVNTDKTFVKGPFRESCGGDYFLGSNIRGVYVKSLNTPASRYSVINLLTQFSTRTGLFLPRCIGRLTETVRFLPIPCWENIESGIRVPFCVARPFLGRDYKTQGFTYKALRAVARRVRVNENADVVVPYRVKSLISNPDGLYLGFLQGSITGMSWAVRNDNVRYITKRQVTSLWDNGLDSHCESLAQPWKTVAGFYFERD